MLFRLTEEEYIWVGDRGITAAAGVAVREREREGEGYFGQQMNMN